MQDHVFDLSLFAEPSVPKRLFHLTAASKQFVVKQCVAQSRGEAAADVTGTASANEDG